MTTDSRAQTGSGRDRRPGATARAEAVRAHRWGLISNHGAALGVIARDPNITVREVAQAVGVTERSATNILRDLRDAGFVDVQRVGRRNYYSVKLEQRLRREGYQESTVGELLAALHAMTALDMSEAGAQVSGPDVEEGDAAGAS